MPNRRPGLYNKRKVCIICEGNEEYKYIDRLKELKVWNEQYEVSLVNAEGNGNIPARYQDRYQNGAYEVVLIFCDTDKKPYEQYDDIKRKINEFHGIDGIANEIIIFGNPCTMQIILKHWTDEMLTSQAKQVNAPIIEEHTKVKGYKGKENQIKEIMNCITTKNYSAMRERVKLLDQNDSIIGNSNFSKIIEWLESENCEWIDKINKMLENE